MLVLVGAFGWAVDQVLLRNIILQTKTSGAYKIHRMLNASFVNEIPVLGSSRAEVSFLPGLIGDNVFNYGISATQDNVWLTLLKEELAKNKHTPVLINLDPDGFSEDIGNPRYLIPIRHGTIDSLMGEKFSWYMQFPFLRFFGNYDFYIREFIQYKRPLEKFIDHGAIVEQRENPSFSQDISLQLNNKEDFTIDKKLVEEFSLLISQTERKIILVMAPLHPVYFVGYEGLIKKDSLLGKLSHDHANLISLDYSRFLVEDSLFFNTTHVNYQGAVSFSRQLKSDLDGLGVLPYVVP